MKRFDWKALRIKSKKDWVIFWIFTVLVCYCLGHPYSYRVNTWLREKLGNPWLGEINEPQPYGRMIAAAVILAVIVEVVLFLGRKRLRAKLAALAAGVLVPVLMAVCYQMNCRLIVSVLWDTQPRLALFSYTGEEERISGEIAGQDIQEILDLARNMTVVSDKAEKDRFMKWYEQDGVGAFLDADRVCLYFPEKYGHDYTLEIRCIDGYVYFWRGHGSGQTDLVTLFEDNGVAQLVEQLKGQLEGEIPEG